MSRNKKGVDVPGHRRTSRADSGSRVQESGGHRLEDTKLEDTKLEDALISKLQQFLLELGKRFAFARQGRRS